MPRNESELEDDRRIALQKILGIAFETAVLCAFLYGTCCFFGWLL